MGFCKEQEHSYQCGGPCASTRNCSLNPDLPKPIQLPLIIPLNFTIPAIHQLSLHPSSVPARARRRTAGQGAGARPRGPTFVGDLPRDLKVEAERLRHVAIAEVQARLAHLCSPPPRCPLASGFTARGRRLLSSAGHSRTVHGRDLVHSWPASVGRIARRSI